MGVKSAVLGSRFNSWMEGGTKDVPEHLVALAQSKGAEVNVFEEFSDGHEVDQTVAFFAAVGLVTEALGEQEVRNESEWICFDDGKDEYWEEDVA